MWKLILLLSAKKIPAVPNGGALERCFYLGLTCQVSLNGLAVPTAVTGALQECAEGKGNVRDPAGRGNAACLLWPLSGVLSGSEGQLRTVNTRADAGGPWGLHSKSTYQ